MKGLEYMWPPRDLIDGIRRLFVFRDEPEPTAVTYRRHPRGEVFARATPEVVRIVETYSYQQEISRNRELNSDPAQPPKGRMTIVVPFDGDHYFSRRAKDDVAIQIPPNNPDPTSALVGHVVLDNCGKADFRSVGNRDGDVTSIPIRVPVSGPGIPPGYDHLISDNGSCVLTHEYEPDPSRPEIMPVTVAIELRDPDSDDFLEISEPGDVDTKVLAAKLRTQQDFHPYLELRVTVELHVATDDPGLRPEVSLVSIGWPTVTSPSAFSLLVSGKDYPLRYNPVDGCIEWRDVRLRPVRKKDVKRSEDTDREDDAKVEEPAGEANETEEADETEGTEDTADDDTDEPDNDAAEADADADDADDEDETPDDGDDRDDAQGPAIRTYVSPPMSLLILQPGELYREEKLRATVDVSVNRLLSGIQARLYDGTGRRAKDFPPEVSSEVSTQVKMILGDAFADRRVSTAQHLYFDEVLLDPARIEDIKNVLVANGFECTSSRTVSHDPEVRLMFYRRREGTDYLELGYLLESTHYTTEREKVVGTETFTTSLASGDLRVFTYGTLRNNSREITRAMNRLHQVFRSQFAHVRVRR